MLHVTAYIKARFKASLHWKPLRFACGAYDDTPTARIVWCKWNLWLSSQGDESVRSEHAKQHVIVVGPGSRGAYFLYPPVSLYPSQPLVFSSGGGGNGASQRERFLLSPIFLCHKIKDRGYNNKNIKQAAFALPKYAYTSCTLLSQLS